MRAEPSANVARVLVVAAPRKLTFTCARSSSPSRRSRTGGATSDALEHCPRPETTAAAHCDERKLPVGAFELVQRSCDETRAGGAGGVTERDRAAVGVDLRHVGLELALP